MKARSIREHPILSATTCEATSALAYPSTEADAVYFWHRLMDRFGLIFLCTPAQSIAPDAYFANRGMLTGKTREKIAQGLEAGQIDPALIASGAVVAVEFESRASNAKSHFEKDGGLFISLLCCIENDWPDSPVPVWALEDHLDILRGGEAIPLGSVMPTVGGSKMSDGGDEMLDQDIVEQFDRVLRSNAQRLALIAFLHPSARAASGSEGPERVLHAKEVRKLMNAISVENGMDEIKDVGGVLTAFTQEGEKKALGLLRKGVQAIKDGKRGSEYHLPARFLPYVHHMRRRLGLRWSAIDKKLT